LPVAVVVVAEQQAQQLPLFLVVQVEAVVQSQQQVLLVRFHILAHLLGL
jgi:hypothetical protein